MVHRTISHLLSNYGMAIVLLLLCIYYSWATLQKQELWPEEAADAVSRKVSGTEAKPLPLVVAGTSTNEANFVEFLRMKTWVGRIEHDPPSTRAALVQMIAAGNPPAVIVCSEESAKWLPSVLASIPTLANTPLITPGSYLWPTFLQKDNLLNVANQIVVIAVIAVGMTMVIITGGIDLSVGSLVALSAVVTGLLIRDHAGGAAAGTMALLVCSIAGILAAGLVGAFSGAMITFFRVPPFIATLGMMQVASGLAYIFSAGQSIYDIPQSFTALSRNGILILVIAYLVVHVIMSRTKLGRYIYAVGGNSEAARLSGVRVGAILMTVYIVSGMVAGLGGVILASQLKSSSPTYGQAYELYVIAAVVVGGASLSGGQGRILGTLIGALIMAVIQNGMNLTGVESYRQKVVLGLVILGAVLLDTLKKRPWKLPRWLHPVDSSKPIKESNAPIS
ncbi:MAG TPA: ABC transporter permease [Tepidisphaeraceae bacterium]|jgi:ribose transport system permease protein|nr:ABC transporter permease [Tepidisphaeraceae bacterium]